MILLILVKVCFIEWKAVFFSNYAHSSSNLKKEYHKVENSVPNFYKVAGTEWNKKWYHKSNVTSFVHY